MIYDLVKSETRENKVVLGCRVSTAENCKIPLLCEEGTFEKTDEVVFSRTGVVRKAYSDE
jgi:hypothetical protein